MRLLAVCVLVCVPAWAYAQRATEQYAPTQIGVARDFLERARAAAGLGELSEADTDARQAQLDARIAWGMTDAADLRAQAADIAAQAAALSRGLSTQASASR
jgi:hypothetical protein